MADSVRWASMDMDAELMGDGALMITVTFKLGADLDAAQVLVQNGVAIAEPWLPEDVRRLGVNVRKNSPDLMMVIHILSPDGTLDQLCLSNHARTQIMDRLARVTGIGNVRIFAERACSMRLWLDPERAAARNLMSAEVVVALPQNNAQVASGTLNQLPVPMPGAFKVSIETQGRFSRGRVQEHRGQAIG